MKSVNCCSLILCLLLLQAICLRAQEKPVGEALASLIRDADDIRVVLVDNVDEYTAYQSVLPEGRQALAQVIAEAELKPMNENGSDMAVSDYLLMNVRHQGELVGNMALVAHFAYTIKPGKVWYRAIYKGAHYADETVPAERSFIERRARAAVLEGVKKGSWKKVEGSLKGFLNVELSGAR